MFVFILVSRIKFGTDTVLTFIVGNRARVPRQEKFRFRFAWRSVRLQFSQPSRLWKAHQSGSLGLPSTAGMAGRTEGELIAKRNETEIFLDEEPSPGYQL